MRTTHHAQQRMSQRGITKDMIDFTLEYGHVNGDAWELNRKQALQRIHELRRELKIAIKLADKGGLVVVAENEMILTAYDYDSRRCAY